jgi:hypothetical protein
MNRWEHDGKSEAEKEAVLGMLHGSRCYFIVDQKSSSYKIGYKAPRGLTWTVEGQRKCDRRLFEVANLSESR